MAPNEEFERRHRKQKLSTSSFPFLSTHNSSASISSCVTPPPEKNSTLPLITPCIREQYYGQSLRMRSNCQMEFGQDSCNGPPDLIHYGKYFGSRSSQYLTNDFISRKFKTGNEEYSKDDDGYVGYYHYANGISIDRGESIIEDYILDSIGLEKVNDEYSWKKDVRIDFSGSGKRPLVIIFCAYNIFSKSDFRAKFKVSTIGSAKSYSVNIEKTYQIIPNSVNSRNRKVYSLNNQTIRDLSSSFWEELAVSEIVRLFDHLDNPSKQITGLVSYNFLTMSKQALIKSVKLLVKYLSKGTMTETDPAVGSITGTGGNVDHSRKTNQYKNSLIDSLLRLCQLEAGGRIGEIAIREIKSKYYSSAISLAGEWDIIILKILKVLGGVNNETEYIRLIHEHVQSTNIHNTQLALILNEQVKYLISKKDYEKALKIAKFGIKILPLDFESWYDLALCYILVQDFRNALLVINSIPVIISQKQKNIDIDNVAGIKDLFLQTFVDRLNNNEEVISEKTFEAYFPRPKINASEYPRYISISKKSTSKDSLIETGSILKIWDELFLFNPHFRHPINGNQFFQSPLMNSSARELSSVDPNLIKLCGPSAMKIILSAQSSGMPSTSILDFNRKSTWGRCYDLLSFFIALIGWDTLIRLKENVFKLNTTPEKLQLEYVVNNDLRENTQVVCEDWLDQLFLIIYEDLRSLMLITAYDKEQHHSAIEWEMLGLLGWSVKYNLKESISALITSVMGTAALGGFDYFGTVKLLEIYDEFILRDCYDSSISMFHDDYELRFHSHKLILNLSEDVHDDFIKSLDTEYLTLDFILLNLMKLISWNIRWYQYIPNYLITRILTKLCTKYDLVFIRSKTRVVFEQNKLNNAFNAKNKKGKFFFNSLLGNSTSAQPKGHEFLDTDTIVDYAEKLIGWIDEINLLENNKK